MSYSVDGQHVLDVTEEAGDNEVVQESVTGPDPNPGGHIFSADPGPFFNADFQSVRSIEASRMSQSSRRYDDNLDSTSALRMACPESVIPSKLEPRSKLRFSSVHNMLRSGIPETHRPHETWILCASGCIDRTLQAFGISAVGEKDRSAEEHPRSPLPSLAYWCETISLA